MWWPLAFVTIFLSYYFHYHFLCLAPVSFSFELKYHTQCNVYILTVSPCSPNWIYALHRRPKVTWYLQVCKTCCLLLHVSKSPSYNLKLNMIHVVQLICGSKNVDNCHENFLVSMTGTTQLDCKRSKICCRSLVISCLPFDNLITKFNEELNMLTKVTLSGQFAQNLLP
jgi:hypothetical protein